MWLNINSNDTDGDGILDLDEINTGTDPGLIDSDWDGIIDSEDPDTRNPWGGEIVLVYDANASNTTIAFGQLLANYSSVTVMDSTEFLFGHTDAQYIVIVGRPTQGTTGTSALVYDLLEDTGSMLTTMMDTETDNIAVRYCTWNDPQTIVMLSGANVSDVQAVLQILKYFEMSLLPDSVLVEYNVDIFTHNASIAYAFPVNTIDSVKRVDASVTVVLSGSAQPRIVLSKYNDSTTPHQLMTATGLLEGDVSLGRYLDVSLTLYGTTLDVFQSALIIFYYRESDLDWSGNGALGDIGDINETTLSLYHYDNSANEWTKVTEDLDWVLDIGQNTTNIEIYGENYGGYLWIHTTELSLFAIAGQLNEVALYADWMTIFAIAISGFVLVGVIFAMKRIRRHSTDRKHSQLLDDLLD